MVLGLTPILSEARAIWQTSASRAFSLLLKSFASGTDVDDSSTDSHIPNLPAYLAKEIREGELASIVRELSDPMRSCLACMGGYGMGKSTMALLAIHDKSIRVAVDHRYWINCHALTDTSSFLQILAAQMGIPPAEFEPTACKTRLDTIVAMIQRLHPPGRIMLVLDDLDHLYFLDKVFAETAIKTLTTINGLVVLLTANGWASTPPPFIQWTLHLQPLSQRMAEYLFQSIYPVPHQRKQLTELLKLVGGIPQYIVVLANLAYQRRLGPADLLQIIDDPATNLLGAHLAGQRSLEESMRAYTPEDKLGHDPHALRVFHVLAALPGGVSRGRLQPYVGLPLETINSVCDQLSRLSFIETEHTGHLILTRPVREYALRFSEFDEQTRQMLLAQIISLAEIPKSRLRPGAPEFLQTVRQFEDERANLENILFSFLDKHLPIAVEAALQYLQPLCAVRPSLKLAIQAVQVAEKLSDPLLLARALRTMGEVQYTGGNFDADKVFARAEVLFLNSQPDDSEVGVIGALECRFFLSEIRHRSGLMHYETDGLIYAEGFEDAVQRASTLFSEAGKRCHAHGVLKLAAVTEDTVCANRLRETAQSVFEDLKDDYGRTLCELYSGKLSLMKAAAIFQDFGDLQMAAQCYHSVAPGGLEYIKIHGSREIVLSVLRRSGMDQILKLLKKTIDIYEVLGRHLDVAFSQYHLAQLLPPNEAISLYSRAIYQFNLSRFTHHRERAQLDMCYSLMEEGSYTEAVAYLEVLQHQIGYCGHLFTVRCRELLTECHCRLNALRPALQAVRATLVAIQELDSSHSSEIESLTPKYTNLLAALDGPPDTLPAIAFQAHAEMGSRFIELPSELEITEAFDLGE
ncbi:hypothetical protein K438DRAFT_2018724 [Mycena galopus ATCC 62051]|nr:hypothetical protein K438DRAFT_2018724 [Mycena galopus ATCC 62051]